VNIIRVSEVDLGALARIAAGLDRAGPDVVYVADSNGSLFPERAAQTVHIVAAETAVQLGFHAHDGLRLAFSNTLAAVDAGCRYVDASLGGLGKGGGNLRLELIASYLVSRRAADFDLVPLARAAAEIIEPMRGGSSIAECDSIVSGLLDLNTDEIAELRGGMTGGLIPLLAGRTPAIPAGAR
jgi:4-hydroxy 2-oxovalerate aldolase